MSLETHHPLYDTMSERWRTMRDTEEGEDQVKESNFRYMPPTKGQVADGAVRSQVTGSKGWDDYQAYKNRAKFEELIEEAVDTLVGVMHQEPALIELPEEMESLRESATRKGESLQQLLREINVQQLLMGRIGLLDDLPQSTTDPDVIPHIVKYLAEEIINWDDEFRTEEMAADMLAFVVLVEDVIVRGTGNSRFDWEPLRRFRVLEIDETGTYHTFVEEDDLLVEEVTPLFRGKALTEIPFTFVGASDLTAAPEIPPLHKLARDAIKLYQKSADYEQALHLQAQDTLHISGEVVTPDGDLKDDGTPIRVGAGSVIYTGDGGKVEFVGVSGEGLSEMRQSYQADLNLALQRGPRLLEGRKGQAESGEALTIRVSASTASLQQIALTGAAGLQDSLRNIAEWIGADPESVIVKPNTDFTDESQPPRNLLELVTARNEGAVLSDQTIHAYAQREDFTEMTFEEEKALWEAEKEEREAKAMEIALSTANAEREAAAASGGDQNSGGNGPPDNTQD